MDYALVLISVFAVFIPALLLPGPDFVAVVRSSMTYGSRSGLLTTLGVSLGLCLYASLSLLGLSAILVKYQWLTWAVRALGGAYLIFLGIRLLRAKPQKIELDQAATRPSRHRAVLFGFLVTLTNPEGDRAVRQRLRHGRHGLDAALADGRDDRLVTASSLTWYSCVSLFMSSDPVMRRFQNARHWIEKAAGVCFIGLGGKVLTDAGNPISP